ncbi:hypothetical protein DWG18_11415 [Lysobacter sp. TY2-98]|uniref:hypothetical protein n=1 Tax=Lysobacter sp. TY2-98 TaxID=2290922 RepID=UPI000E2044D8|nr:hypothetical protein [Lysobacter sp. TY2-98]AXK72827.1 hypothetical protein DWG18_11415 [Lysobacter sp. TY2-98]
MGDGARADFFDCRAAAQLLTYDLMRAVRTMTLDAVKLARVLDIDAHQADAVLSGRELVHPASPMGQRSVRLVRLHRALGDAFGTTDAVVDFLTSPDPDDGSVPASVLEQPDGIERVFARLNCIGVDEWRPASCAMGASGSMSRTMEPQAFERESLHGAHTTL